MTMAVAAAHPGSTDIEVRHAALDAAVNLPAEVGEVRLAPSDEAVLPRLAEPASWNAENVPVRNTFIHFQDDSRKRTRILRKNNTDPPPAPPPGLGAPEQEGQAPYFGACASPVQEDEEEVFETLTEALEQYFDFDFSPTPEPSPRSVSVEQLSISPDDREQPSPAPPARLALDVLTSEKELSPAPRARIVLDELVVDSPRPTRKSLSKATALSATPILSKMSPPTTATTPSTPNPALRQSSVLAPEMTPEPKSLTCSPARQFASPLPAVPVYLEGDGSFFNLTLRRPDETGLGLQVEPTNDDRSLIVRAVVSGGAVEAFNNQAKARGGAAASKAIQPGDRIVCVNGSVEVDAMLNEIKNHLLLKLLVVRPGPPCIEVPPRLPAAIAQEDAAALGLAVAAAVSASARLTSTGIAEALAALAHNDARAPV